MIYDYGIKVSKIYKTDIINVEQGTETTETVEKVLFLILRG